jgi:hypothetical protein
MAKKQEFRPDKPSATLLSRLTLTPKQQRKLFKWVFYGIFLVLLSVIQDVMLSRVRVSGATTELGSTGDSVQPAISRQATRSKSAMIFFIMYSLC